jgi:hypothetical protein
MNAVNITRESTCGVVSGARITERRKGTIAITPKKPKTLAISIFFMGNP